VASGFPVQADLSAAEVTLRFAKIYAEQFPDFSLSFHPEIFEFPDKNYLQFNTACEK